MAYYLDTNALRRIKEFTPDMCTSILAIFELMSGITKEEYNIRQACLKRIADQDLKIREPMVDVIFLQLNHYPVQHSNTTSCIRCIFEFLLSCSSYDEFTKFTIPQFNLNALSWLRNYDNRISNITKKSQEIMNGEEEWYIRNLFNNQGLKGLADHFWQRLCEQRYNDNALEHVEAFVGQEQVDAAKRAIDSMIENYSYKLFYTAQASIFAEAYINGNEQNRNNPFDLLHLLYFSEDDIMVSDDNIYQKIKETSSIFTVIKVDELSAS